MKKITIFLTLLTTLSCCSKDDDNQTLPPATQTGANTVGCLVNGKVFLPYTDSYIYSPVNVFYQYIDGEFFFSLSFRNDRTSESVTVGTGFIELEAGQTYVLDKNSKDDGDYTGGGGTYHPPNTSLDNRYYTKISSIGELTITRVDLSNSIISGTFWFDAINKDGDTVKIRDGRFDYNY